MKVPIPALLGRHGNFLLVFQVFGTVIVVAVGVVHAAALENQESRRFSDTDSIDTGFFWKKPTFFCKTQDFSANS